jgi:hypothetical protein
MSPAGRGTLLPGARRARIRRRLFGHACPHLDAQGEVLALSAARNARRLAKREIQVSGIGMHYFNRGMEAQEVSLRLYRSTPTALNPAFPSFDTWTISGGHSFRIAASFAFQQLSRWSNHSAIYSRSWAVGRDRSANMLNDIEFTSCNGSLAVISANFESLASAFAHAR